MSDFESSNDNILDEILQTQESVDEQYVSKDRKDKGKKEPLIQLVIQLHHAVFCNKNVDQPILLKECVQYSFIFYCVCAPGFTSCGSYVGRC